MNQDFQNAFLSYVKKSETSKDSTDEEGEEIEEIEGSESSGEIQFNVKPKSEDSTVDTAPSGVRTRYGGSTIAQPEQEVTDHVMKNTSMKSAEEAEGMERRTSRRLTPGGSRELRHKSPTPGVSTGASDIIMEDKPTTRGSYRTTSIDSTASCDSEFTLGGDRSMDASPSASHKSTSPRLETLVASRPKRNIIPKNLDFQAGLSWREEHDLKRALAMSMQDQKRPPEGAEGLTSYSGTHGGHTAMFRAPSGLQMNQSQPGVALTGSGAGSVYQHQRSKSAGDLVKPKVHAQRKFAQGSRPGSPSVSPAKKKSSPKKFFTTKKAKTEDFLTFLCLRNSHILPPHLDFYNIDDSDESNSNGNHSNGNGNHSNNGSNTPRGSRPSTPALTVRESPRGKVNRPLLAGSPDRPISLHSEDLGVKPLPRYNTPDSSPAKKFAEISTSSPKSKKVPSSPARGGVRSAGGVATGSSSPSKRKSPSKLNPVVKIKRVRPDTTKRSPEKKNEHAHSGSVATGRGERAAAKKGKIVTSVMKRSKVQTAASNTVKKALKIGRLNVRATRATTAAIEAAKLQQEQRRATSKVKADPKVKPEVKDESKMAAAVAMETVTTTPLVKSAKSKTPLKSQSEKKGENPKPSPLKTRSTSKLRTNERENMAGKPLFGGAETVGKLAKKRQSEGEGEGGSRLPRKLLLVDTASLVTLSADRKSPDRRSVRSRSMSNDSMPPFSPIKSEAPDIIDLDAYEDSFTDSPSATPVKVKKKKKRDKSKQKGDKSHKKDKKDKNRSEKSPRKKDRLEKHSKEYKKVKKKLKLKMKKMKARLRAQEAAKSAASPSDSSSGSSSGGVSSGTGTPPVSGPGSQSAHESQSTSSLTSSVTSSPLKQQKIKSSKPAEHSISSSTKSPVPKMAVRSGFPLPSEPGTRVDLPTYHPSTEQFMDPISYIASIRSDAEPYGMCRVVPPDEWKPDCVIPQQLRFTTQMQYIHKMYRRWGENVRKTECIRKHIEENDGKLDQAPMVGGIEVDLPLLYEEVKKHGGMQHVIDKHKWGKIADALHIPKNAPERQGRLEDAYCKYLLSYDLLPSNEKQRIETEIAQLEEEKLPPSHPVMECTSKGRSRMLNEFFRIAGNHQSFWFSTPTPTPEEVEEEYWAALMGGERHVGVQGAHVNTKGVGSGFPTKKDSPYCKHGWNFNVLQHNSGSLLRCLGQVSGVTVPVLHVNMLFTTSCWTSDTHLLPYIVYKHTGADSVWYCIPDSEKSKFQKVAKELVPDLVKERAIWLPKDTAMIPPSELVSRGVSVARTVHKAGQFLVVFPRAYTSSISCGYSLTESIRFATTSWLPLACHAAQLLYDSRVHDLFSTERLLFTLAKGEKTTTETLRLVLPHIISIVERELCQRKALQDAGIKTIEKMSSFDDSVALRKTYALDDEDNRCTVSNKICYLSMVVNEADNKNLVFSLEHALPHVTGRKKNLRMCKMMIRQSEEELRDVITKMRARLAAGNHHPARRKAKK